MDSKSAERCPSARSGLAGASTTPSRIASSIATAQSTAVDAAILLATSAQFCPVARGTAAAVSQHLTVLKTAGLLDERRDGTRRLYRARPEGLSEIRELLDTMWASALDTARRIVEQDRGGPVTTQPPAPNSAAPHGPGPSGSSAEAN